MSDASVENFFMKRFSSFPNLPGVGSATQIRHLATTEKEWFYKKAKVQERLKLLAIKGS
jgi:hypothetical protein